MNTATFIITLDGKFLPPQLIHGGKAVNSFPRIDFPSSFCLNVNEKHYSNKVESVKVLKEILIPYSFKERGVLCSPANQHALLIMDVFKGQMTNNVLKFLKDYNIFLGIVPANLTYLFQQLDVQGGPNGYVKRYMKNKSCEWYSTQVTQALVTGKETDEIKVPLKFSILKPLTEEDGRKVCMKGWEVAVLKELASLPNLDPFNDITSITESDADLYSQAISINKIQESSKYVYNESVYTNSESGDEWFEQNEDIGS